MNASCHGKLFACHFGDACHRFVSPAINCSKYILALSNYFLSAGVSQYLQITLFAVEANVLQVYWGPHTYRGKRQKAELQHKTPQFFRYINDLPFR